jgi:iron complex transport system ATP-binding protein
MLLDEPTANLDIAHSLDVLELCRKLVQDGKAICIALHDINAAARYADEIVLLNAGRVFKQGAPDEVFQEESLNEVFEVCTDRTQTADGKAVFVFYRDAP